MESYLSHIKKSPLNIRCQKSNIIINRKNDEKVRNEINSKLNNAISNVSLNKSTAVKEYNKNNLPTRPKSANIIQIQNIKRPMTIVKSQNNVLSLLENEDCLNNENKINNENGIKKSTNQEEKYQKEAENKEEGISKNPTDINEQEHIIQQKKYIKKYISENNLKKQILLIKNKKGKNTNYSSDDDLYSMSPERLSAIIKLTKNEIEYQVNQKYILQAQYNEIHHMYQIKNEQLNKYQAILSRKTHDTPSSVLSPKAVNITNSMTSTSNEPDDQTSHLLQSITSMKNEFKYIQIKERTYNHILNRNKQEILYRESTNRTLCEKITKLLKEESVLNIYITNYKNKISNITKDINYTKTDTIRIKEEYEYKQKENEVMIEEYKKLKKMRDIRDEQREKIIENLRKPAKKKKKAIREHGAQLTTQFFVKTQNLGLYERLYSKIVLGTGGETNTQQIAERFNSFEDTKQSLIYLKEEIDNRIANLDKEKQHLIKDQTDGTYNLNKNDDIIINLRKHRDELENEMEQVDHENNQAGILYNSTRNNFSALKQSIGFIARLLSCIDDDSTNTMAENRMIIDRDADIIWKEDHFLKVEAFINDIVNKYSESFLDINPEMEDLEKLFSMYSDMTLITNHDRPNIPDIEKTDENDNIYINDNKENIEYNNKDISQQKPKTRKVSLSNPSTYHEFLLYRPDAIPSREDIKIREKSVKDRIDILQGKQCSKERQEDVLSRKQSYKVNELPADLLRLAKQYYTSQRSICITNSGNRLRRSLLLDMNDIPMQDINSQTLNDPTHGNNKKFLFSYHIR